MMDCVSSYNPMGGIHREGETESASCDNSSEEIETSKRFALPKDSSALAIRSMSTTKYVPTEMEGALRIMNHAGRILWRAAMEAVPQSGRSYNPPLRVLTKLFQRSFGKSSETTTSLPTKSSLLSSFGSSSRKHARESSEDSFTSKNSEAEDDVVMESIPEPTMDCDEIIYETGGDIQSQGMKKRKTLSTCLSFLPTVVSDSEEEQEENFRPPKRTRHNLQEDPLGWDW